MYSPVQGLYLQGCRYVDAGPIQERQRPCRRQSSDFAGRTAAVVIRRAAAASRSLKRVMKGSFPRQKENRATGSTKRRCLGEEIGGGSAAAASLRRCPPTKLPP